MGIKELAEIKKIEILLDKYWRGESSTEEEAILKSYFTGDNVAGHLKYIRDLLSRMAPEKGRHFLWLGGPTSKNIIKVAAAVILVLTATFLFRPTKTDQDINVEKAQLGTFDDPEEAYAQVRKSLQLVSAKLNKGSGYVKELSKFNKGATLFNRQKVQKTQDEQ